MIGESLCSNSPSRTNWNLNKDLWSSSTAANLNLANRLKMPGNFSTGLALKYSIRSYFCIRIIDRVDTKKIKVRRIKINFVGI